MIAKVGVVIGAFGITDLLDFRTQMHSSQNKGEMESGKTAPTHPHQNPATPSRDLFTLITWLQIVSSREEVSPAPAPPAYGEAERASSA